MGEVFRAHDTKLNRDVAIKVLPATFAQDHERVARFKREAQVLASLNHPNIAAIYGLEEADASTLRQSSVQAGPGTGSASGSIVALVMELVEGEDLSAHIARGPIPLAEALPIGRQIAEALEAAHEQGIVHRDLKPGNIKVRADGTVKVLDFGLAKAMDPSGGSNPDVSHSPTLTHQGTQAGMIIGTAAYMSPEQAKGKTVDKRADIWAFGVVLYEMLTGKRAFKGEDVSETLASVLKDTLSMDGLPTTAPPRLKRLIERCLERDLKNRLRDIGEARFEISRIESGAPDMSSVATAESPSSRGSRFAWPAFAVAALAAVILAVPAIRHLLEAPPVVMPETRLDINTPSGPDPLSFALSPDGRQIVFVASGDGQPRLWLRSLGATTAQPLAGTEGAVFPFWSPDSRSVGFVAGGQLQRLDLGGGAPQRLAAAGPRGGTWNADGVILFAPSLTGTLSRIAAAGGDVAPATALDRQTSHRWPVFLPDGRHFLFYAQGGTDTGGIWLGALDATTRTRLTPADTAGTYLPGGSGHADAGRDAGWLVWVRGGTLVAQRLDLARAALTGDPTPLAVAVAVDGPFNRSAVSVSATGLVAYRSGGASRRQLTWRDRTGRVLGTLGAPDENGLMGPSVAPDGRRVVVSRAVQGNQDLWLLDGTRTSRFTFEPGTDNYPIWSPDSSRITFRSNRTGVFNLYAKDASGAGMETLLVESAQFNTPGDWSADGRFLIYHSLSPETDYDLWVKPMEGDAKPWVFLKTPFDERQGRFSPDGRFVAYMSTESGRPEIYVRPFAPPASSGSVAGAAAPAPSGQWQVSTAGGIQPSWRADGKEIYYLGPDGVMMAAAITVRGTAVEPGTPVALFQTHILGGGVDNQQGRQYDVTRDGRFLINTVLDDAAATPITLIQNWQPPVKQ